MYAGWFHVGFQSEVRDLEARSDELDFKIAFGAWNSRPLNLLCEQG
jgi:hypothetical protein